MKNKRVGLTGHLILCCILATTSVQGQLLFEEHFDDGQGNPVLDAARWESTTPSGSPVAEAAIAFGHTAWTVAGNGVFPFDTGRITLRTPIDVSGADGCGFVLTYEVQVSTATTLLEGVEVDVSPDGASWRAVGLHWQPSDGDDWSASSVALTTGDLGGTDLYLRVMATSNETDQRVAVDSLRVELTPCTPTPPPTTPASTTTATPPPPPTPRPGPPTDYHVDGVRGDDSTADGTFEAPFRTIAAGLRAATSSIFWPTQTIDVHVWPATYEEAIDVPQRIRLLGKSPRHVVLDGGNAPAVVRLHDQTELRGLRIGSTSSSPLAACVEVYRASTVTIESTVLHGCRRGMDINEATDVTVTNVTMADLGGTGLHARYSSVTLINDIIADNGGTAIYSYIGTASDDGVVVTYTDVWNNSGGNLEGPFTAEGLGLLFADPAFANQYYELSAGSPCIDSGVGTDPDGSPADRGAFGGENFPTEPLPVPWGSVAFAVVCLGAALGRLKEGRDGA